MLPPRTVNSRRLCAIALIVGLLASAGCGGPNARVTGKVTCDGKPVVGGILFSPKGEDENNKGPAVPGVLKEDGNFDVRLTTIGKHTVVVTPSDLRYPVKPGQIDYPCDRSPQEREIKAGDNVLEIELPKRKS